MTITKYDISNDTELLRRIGDDDQVAYTKLFAKYWQQLYQAAFKVLRDEQRSEDIVQEVFMQLWDKRKELRIEKSLVSYLHTVVKYKVFFDISRNKCRQELFIDIPERLSDETPEQLLNYKETKKSIEKLVNCLPDRCREVYVLSRSEFLSHKEIAEKLGISTKTVENQLTKALKSIRLLVKSLLMLLTMIIV